MARPAAVFILSDDELELAKHNSKRGGGEDEGESAYRFSAAF